MIKVDYSGVTATTAQLEKLQLAFDKFLAENQVQGFQTEAIGGGIKNPKP